MTTYVADTHALYWYLTKSPRLGAQAREAFMAGDQGNAAIFVPAIVLAELFYLNRKLKNVLDFAKVVEELLRAGQFVLLPLIAEDTLDFDLDQAVPEMHDRIIVGAARRLNAPLLTRDVPITQSGVVATIW